MSILFTSKTQLQQYSLIYFHVTRSRQLSYFFSQSIICHQKEMITSFCIPELKIESVHEAGKSDLDLLNLINLRQFKFLHVLYIKVSGQRTCKQIKFEFFINFFHKILTASFTLQNGRNATNVQHLNSIIKSSTSNFVTIETL